MSSSEVMTIEQVSFLETSELIYLDLSNNMIQTTDRHDTEWLQNLTYLKHLDLSGNKIGGTANMTGSLGSIDTFIASNIGLNVVPSSWLKTSPNLKHLDIGDNPFDCFCALKPLQSWIQSDTLTYLNPKHSYVCRSPETQEDFGFSAVNLDCRLSKFISLLVLQFLLLFV